METMTAAEAKQKFGQLLDKAQRGPVQITKNGRPSVYLISAEDFEENQRWEQFLFKRKLERAREQVERGETIPADVVFRELREKYLNKENLDAAE